jgi:hypothetical protein
LYLHLLVSPFLLVASCGELWRVVAGCGELWRVVVCANQRGKITRYKT